MIIEVSDEWRIKVEPMNFILEQLVEVKPKDKPAHMDWKFCGYFPDPETALKALPGHLMQSRDLETMSGLSARWERVIAQFTRRVGKA